MEVRAIAKNIKGSVQKVKIPVDVVRGMSVDDALPILEYMPKKAAKDVYKVLFSARANAINNYNLNPDHLYIKEIRVDKARRLKRYKSGSRGRVKPISREFSTVSVSIVDILTEAENATVKEEKITKTHSKKEVVKKKSKVVTDKAKKTNKK
ncbi:MAG: 50S ribosomal protein L22 [Candidatus Dojkabacteria bacterium]|nr:50S ribosomal protein L22 [Candidatus Dojkabacteria bacterium]MDQ7021384.1 50S ribosomal protein L22 [Candidatus Dojkabacteria bacterium]